MSQTKLKASSSKSKKTKTHKCKWSSCKGEHLVKIKYPNKGRVEKGGYRDKWINAGMEPWVLHGKIKKRFMKNGKAYKRKTYEYRFEAHHLVPTTLIKKTSTLKKNAVLINYDCDDVANGLILPKYEMDIPLHKLQAHRGNHPNAYMEPIRKKLRRIEKAYDGICNSDVHGNMSRQECLAQQLYGLAKKAGVKINNIRTGRNVWPVRTNALTEYNDHLKEYERRLKLHNKLKNS